MKRRIILGGPQILPVKGDNEKITEPVFGEDSSKQILEVIEKILIDAQNEVDLRKEGYRNSQISITVDIECDTFTDPGPIIDRTVKIPDDPKKLLKLIR